MQLKRYDWVIMGERKGEKKIQRHNVFITQTMGVSAKFSVSISCPFTPTEAKVRAITYFDASGVNAPFSLHVADMGDSGGQYGLPGKLHGARHHSQWHYRTSHIIFERVKNVLRTSRRSRDTRLRRRNHRHSSRVPTPSVSPGTKISERYRVIFVS